MENIATDNEAKTPRRRQFSVASIFLVTALVAVILAALRTAALFEAARKEWVVAIGIAGLLVGAVVGAAIGAAQPAAGRGVLVGLVVGMASGTAAGMLAAMPQSLPVVLLGALVLIAFAALVRRLSKS